MDKSKINEIKSELYSNEQQEELSSKIITILELDPQEHCTTLYELDNDEEKQKTDYCIVRCGFWSAEALYVFYYKVFK